MNFKLVASRPESDSLATQLEIGGWLAGWLCGKHPGPNAATIFHPSVFASFRSLGCFGLPWQTDTNFFHRVVEKGCFVNGTTHHTPRGVASAWGRDPEKSQPCGKRCVLPKRQVDAGHQSREAELLHDTTDGINKSHSTKSWNHNVGGWPFKARWES